MDFKEWIEKNFSACFDDYIESNTETPEDMIKEIIEAVCNRAIMNRSCMYNWVMIEVMEKFFQEHQQPKYTEFLKQCRGETAVW